MIVVGTVDVDGSTLVFYFVFNFTSTWASPLVSSMESFSFVVKWRRTLIKRTNPCWWTVDARCCAH